MPTLTAVGKARMGGLPFRLSFRSKKSMTLTGMKLLMIASLLTHTSAM